MHELQNAYDKSRNGEIRFCTLGWRQWWFLMYLRAKTKNRWRRRLRKLIGRRSLARGCLNCKNSQITIDEFMMNSRDFEAFGNDSSKQMEILTCRTRTKKNQAIWLRFDGVWIKIVWWRFWRVFVNLEGKLVRILENCDYHLQFSYD